MSPLQTVPASTQTGTTHSLLQAALLPQSSCLTLVTPPSRTASLRCPLQPCSLPVKGRASLHACQASLHHENPQVPLEKLPAASTQLHPGPSCWQSWGCFTLPGRGRACTATPGSGHCPVGQFAARFLFRVISSLEKMGGTGGP